MRASRGPVLRSLGGAFEELFAEARCDLDRPVWKIAPAVVVAEDRFPKRAHWPHNVRQRHALVLDARARVSLRSVPHQVVERAPLPGGFCEIVDRRDQVRFQDFAISLADALERRDERLRRREWMGITAVLNLQPFSILGDYAGHSGRGITNRYRDLRNGRQAEDAGLVNAYLAGLAPGLAHVGAKQGR